MDDIVERIQPESESRQVARLLRIRASFDTLAVRAADLIDRQREEIERLREALNNLLNDKSTTYAVRVQRARSALSTPTPSLDPNYG